MIACPLDSCSIIQRKSKSREQAGWRNTEAGIAGLAVAQASNISVPLSCISSGQWMHLDLCQERRAKGQLPSPSAAFRSDLES